jgi:hypothetical protein
MPRKNIKRGSRLCPIVTALPVEGLEVERVLPADDGRFGGL